VVDLLDVLDLGPVLLCELVEGRVALGLVIDVDVGRPVGEVEGLRDLALGDNLAAGALGLRRLVAAAGRQVGDRAHAQSARGAPGRTTAWARSPTSAPVDSQRTVRPASSFSSVPLPLADTTCPGIRFETPMKPATKVVAGRSYTCSGRSTCSITPRFITAMRSD